MKIDGSRSNFDPSLQTKSIDSVKHTETIAANRTKADKGSDEVHLSPDAQLMAKAVAAANRAGEVRADVVDRARKMLASGELGRDADRLAAKIIDRILAATGERIG